ncbi:MAG: lipoprotein-releasing ABC transporter permease subunit [Alphaproteobacteria bacterium]|nr:lipoprotein-releasing ABC transporter permease subunit [Alphaproteobacteria bacterium]
MISAFEWMMARRYLRARRQEGFISVISWFSLLGIALGVATLIVVMSVMNGFRAELLGRILGLNGHAMVLGEGSSLGGFGEIAARIRRIEGVVSATPMIEGQVMVLARDTARGALVRGLDPADLRARELIATRIMFGSIDRLGPEDVVIGQRMAFRLGLRVGQELTLVSPQTAATPFGTVPRMKTYRIAATFEVGMFEYDSSYIFMPLESARLFFRVDAERVTGVEVMLDSPDRLPRVRAQLIAASGGQGRLHDWQQANSSLFTAVQIERNVMFLILTLIILVAAFNIISSLIMLVKDKGRDIAVLRTMGATRGSIMRIFLLAGSTIGVVGTAAGFALGLAFALNIEAVRRFLESLLHIDLFAAEIRFLTQIPAKVDSFEVALTVAMALGLSFLATIYPSWRAARLDPVEALRYE